MIFTFKNPNFPVTVNQGAKVCGMKQHCGHGTLDKLEYYGKDVDTIANAVMDKNPSSDTFFSYMCKRTGREILSTDINVDRGIRLYNEKNPLHKSIGTYNPAVLKEMVELLDKKLGLSFADDDAKAKNEKNTGVKQASSDPERIFETLDVYRSKAAAAKKPPMKPVTVTNPKIRRKLISQRLKVFLRP